MLSTRLFYKTATIDPATDLPVYVFDTSFLPPRLFGSIISNDNNDDEEQQLNQLFIKEMISLMPEEEHAIVLLTAGLTSGDSPNDMASNTEIINIPRKLIKLFKLIPQSKKSFLTKLFVVHGNWLIKSIMDISTTFWSLSNSNTKRTVIHCENLTKLSQFIDITKLNISLSNYLIDKVFYNNDKILIAKHVPKVYGTPLIVSNNLALKQFSRIYNNLLAFLTTPELDTELSSDDWQMVIKASRVELTPEVRLSVDVLVDCLARDQLLYLPDWSFVEHYMVILSFLTHLNDSNQPLFPVSVFDSHASIELSDINSLNMLLDNFLQFNHRVSKHLIAYNSPFTSMKIPNSYNNGYIIIKVLQLFKALQSKLENEFQVIDPSARNLSKARERQNLRLILSFTKVLFNENYASEYINEEDDDQRFDYLFKFLQSVLKNWGSIKVNGSIPITAFAKPITFENFMEYTNQTHEELNDSYANSPVLERTQLLNPKLRRQAPPTPPIPREHQRRMASMAASASRNSSASSSASDSSFNSNSSASLNRNEAIQEDKENPITTASNTASASNTSSLTERLKAAADSSTAEEQPRKPASSRRVLSIIAQQQQQQQQQQQPKNKRTNELVKPSSQVTSKLIKYTEKDLSIQQAQLKDQTTSKSKSRNLKGRNVSKLTMMYEEKLFRDL